jgi:subtilisin family serine protease
MGIKTAGKDKMDEVHLKFGDSEITLTKSDKLIALKPQPNRRRKITHSNLNPKDALNGFELFSVKGSNESKKTMEETLDVIRNSSDVVTGSHVYHTSDDEVPFVPSGEIFIKFKEGADKVKCQALIEKHNLMLHETREGNKYIFKTTELSANPLKVAANLQQETDVIEVAEPSLVTVGKLHGGIILPDDTLIKDQWHLHNVGFHRNTSLSLKAGADARVIRAWEAAGTLGSVSVVVSVIDDGFDLEHPDLYGPNKTHMPWDFTRNSNNPLPDEDTQDWHGTSCAGVAIGNTNSNGIVGAAPGCRLMPVRWGTSLSDTEIENWFKYVADSGAWVVSCSWGAAAERFPLSTRMKDAISECVKKGRSGKGIVICFAAGNSNTDINHPTTYNGFATHPDVIAVAACTSIDTKSHYSCFGKSIFITAPSSGSGGMGILTADVRGNLGYAPGDFTYDFGGTSSATPLVAGICALLFSVKPELTADEVKNILKNTARKIGNATDYDSKGHSTSYGYGCIDAERAVTAILPAKEKKKEKGSYSI